MDSRPFLERPEGVAFWTMMLLSFVFLTYSYAITRTVDCLLIFGIIIAVLISRTVWVVFAWRKPLSVPVEKVERVSFWMTSILAFALLISEYLKQVHSAITYFIFCSAGCLPTALLRQFMKIANKWIMLLPRPRTRDVETVILQ